MVKRALETVIAEAGGPAAFTSALGISPRTLANWRSAGVPDTRWRAVAALAPDKVTPLDLAAERAARVQPADAAVTASVTQRTR
jgi:ribosome biogenesis SPOUT family RNA methylase Rps3